LENDFREGIEAEFFSSAEEAADKIRFFLREDNARKVIAAGGRESCVRNGYSYHGRMRQYMVVIEELLAARSFGAGEWNY